MVKYMRMWMWVLANISIISLSNAQISEQATDPVIFGGAYNADVYSVLNGGVEQKSGYLGMANIRLAIDTKNARLWNGGVAFVNAVCTHGSSPSEAAGDFQVVSNIDAGGDHMYIQECWYKQSLGNVDITAGLQDLNAEFLVCEGGGQFINSSFGVPSVVSDNIPVPIFPLTTLGLSLKWIPLGKIALQCALFDGVPYDFNQNNKYNLNWKINNDDGLFGITELALKGRVFKKSMICKFGAYYHSKLNQIDEISGKMETVFKYNNGLYAIADQNIWSNEDTTRKVDYFIQFAASPKSRNVHNLYFGCGVTCKGICKKRPDDMTGIAIANSFFHDLPQSYETTIEINYSWIVNSNINIQPDIQYIVNPSGSGIETKNSLLGFMRVGIRF